MRKLHGGHGYGNGHGALGPGYGFGQGEHDDHQDHDDEHEVMGYRGFGYGFDGKERTKKIVNKMAAAQVETK